MSDSVSYDRQILFEPVRQNCMCPPVALNFFLDINQYFSKLALNMPEIAVRGANRALTAALFRDSKRAVSSGVRQKIKSV